MRRPDGGIRRSQLLTGYGPGALLDLLDAAVIVGGLEQWRYPDENAGFLVEPRLQAKAQGLLAQRKWAHGAVRLRLPPTCDDDHPSLQAGIGVVQFPRWYLCQSDRCRSLVHRKGLDERGRHQCTHDQKAPISAVPFRFIGACPHGHVQDLDWMGFVHRGQKQDPKAPAGVYCKGEGLSKRPHDPLTDQYTAPLYLNVVGTSGELTDFVLGCRHCGATRGLQDLTVPGAMGKCRGFRPWLGWDGREVCPEPERLKVVTRTQSNLYFPEVLSVLSIPDPGQAVQAAVETAWAFLKAVEEIGELKFVRKQSGAVLAGLSDEAVWHEVQRRQKGLPAPVPATRETEWQALRQAPEAKAGEGPPRGERWWPRKAVIDLPSFVERVVLVHSLTEVRAQIGFTRIDVQAPDAEGEYGPSVSSARLGQHQNWVPAVEIFGEGIFLGLDIEAVRQWEKQEAVKARGAQFVAGYQKHNLRFGSEVEFPGVRLVMLHSLAHLLIQAISLECGYPATAIRERLYCHTSQDPEKERAGILLYTGAPGSEGTLGGLVKAGLDIVHHLRRAAELGRLCSNDPVCAQHLPPSEEDRLRSGASCHGCVLIGEPSCERMNQDLDRTLVVPTVEESEAAFLGPWMATWT